MAGGLVKYRHLSRNSAHRQALLRNLVTSLIKHESIHTTYAKAKEAQRLAEKLITLAKRNNEATLRKATGILYTPHELLPKLFNNLRDRYAERPGGYTRVLRTMPKSTYDQGDSAILQLVDGPRDLRFAITAAAVARDQKLGKESRPLTLLNKEKVTRFRKNGPAAFDKMVARMAKIDLGKENDVLSGKTQSLPTSRTKGGAQAVVPALDVAAAAAAADKGGSKPSVLR